MSKNILQEVVSLAVEVLDSQSSAMDQTREKNSSSGIGKYDKRTWAIDVLTMLPNDREDARAIVRAHCPGQSEVDDPKRLNRLIKEYYRKLERTSLVSVGCRFLHQLR